MVATAFELTNEPKIVAEPQRRRGMPPPGEESPAILQRQRDDFGSGALV